MNNRQVKSIFLVSAYCLLMPSAARAQAQPQAVQRSTDATRKASNFFDASTRMQRVPDEVLAMPVRKMYSSTGGGATSTSTITVPTAFVYKNDVDIGFSRPVDGATTGGVTRPDGSETGSFIAEDLTFGNGFVPGQKIVRYSLRVWRSSLDLKPGAVDVHVELWNGDPTGVIDTTGGYTNTPIVGSEADFVGVVRGQRADLVVEFPSGLLIPEERVWMMLTSNGCRMGWVCGNPYPVIGETFDGVWAEASDDDGVGRCCHNGAVCNELDADSSNDCPSGISCGDGVAWHPHLLHFDGSPSPSFFATVEAEAHGVFSLIPVGCEPPGFCAISGNQIVIPDATIQPNRILLDVGLSQWSAVDGACSTSGDPCRQAADCDVDSGETCEGGPEKLDAYQVTLDSRGYIGQCAGLLSADDQHVCADDATCEALFGTGARCQGSRCQAAFIDTSRADWVYAGVPATVEVDTSNSDYRLLSTVDPLSEVPPPLSDGTTRYGGTFVVSVQPNAAGTFKLELMPLSSSFMHDLSTDDVIPLVATGEVKIDVQLADAPSPEPYALSPGEPFAGKNRYLTFVPPSVPAGATSLALTVRLLDLPGPNDCAIVGDFSDLSLEGRSMWVGQEVLESGTGAPTGVYGLQTEPVFRDWAVELPLVCVGASGTTIGESVLCVDTGVQATCVAAGGVCEPLLVVSDCNVVPCATYTVRAIADSTPIAPRCYTEALTLSTTPAGSACPGTSARWADIVGAFDPIANRYAAADGCTDFIDIEAMLARFKNLTKAPPKSWCDLVGNSTAPYQPSGGLALNVDFLDVQTIVAAFRGGSYSDLGHRPTGANGPCGLGACCSTNELCYETTRETCEVSPRATFLGDGTSCLQFTCHGACCVDGFCQNLHIAQCTGVFQGFGIPCDLYPCE